MRSKIKILSVLSIRNISVFSILLICGLLLLYRAAQAEIPLLAMDGQKIVTASNVRYRAQPALDAEVMGHVGLGAVLPATQRTKEKLLTGELESYWYLIKAGEKQGWVSGQFLRDFKAEQKEKIWFRLIRERMDSPDLSFADRVDLYRFVDSIVSRADENRTDTVGNDASDSVEVNKPEKNNVSIDSDKMSSAFALGRLLALQKAFDKVTWENAKTEPYQTWVKTHEEAKRVFHDEISGQWLVPAGEYWKLADAYKGRQGVDEISWYAANAQLGGECEGDIECNLQREKITYGEYLQRHPHGRYAGKALQRMSASFEYIQQALEREPNYLRKSPAAAEVIETLFDIVADANLKLKERAVAFKQIKAIRRMARQR